MARCDLYMPGFSEARQATERFITVQTKSKFHDIRTGCIARLGRKLMGEQKGLCPIEEVFHLSSVDPGVIVPVGCNDLSPSDDDVQKGIDCFGNVIDIDTRGGAADSPLCRSYPRGSFAIGVDSYRPEFYSYERLFPPMCVDAAMASPKEVKQTLQAIRMDGPRLVISDLDYLMWDLIVKRGTGNTSIAEDVRFGADVGLSNGQFPYLPKSYLNHEFIKRIQEIVMADPDNWGKTLTVEASQHQIEKAIEDDQRIKGIERRSVDRIQDPFRAERTMMYDGIRYIMKDMADYVGVINYATYVTFIRPRYHVHQAGTEHGVVTRPNYEMTRGCTINCGGTILDKYEVAHWYLEDAVFFVPFIAPGNVPTNGKEQIKDHVYATPTSFKTYDVEPHAVNAGAGCINDRGQFQQFGMMTRFGLFHRPDKINFGSILLQPVQRCIELQDNCCPEAVAACLPDTLEVYAADRGAPNSTNCPPCDDSGNTEATGDRLSATPEGGVEPALAEDVPGSYRLVGINFSVTEEASDEIVICVERYAGSMDAGSIDYTTAPGTALAGTNYTTTAGTLAWADGESGSKCVTIPILDDDIVSAVAFTFVITPVAAEDIPGGDTATITINPTPECPAPA